MAGRAAARRLRGDQPEHDGFAGRYNPPSGKIEIAYYASTFVVLHEAAHAWFDGSLLADRWASEGFARGTRSGRGRDRREEGDRRRLTPELGSPRNPAERRGRRRARTARRRERRVRGGPAAREEGRDAGRAGRPRDRSGRRSRRDAATYQPSGPERQRLRRAGAPRTGADCSTCSRSRPACRTTTCGPPGSSGRRDRTCSPAAAVRHRYAAVLARAGTWRLPRVIRDALRVWQYDQADRAARPAPVPSTTGTGATAAAAAAGLTVPPTMETDFEGRRGFAADVGGGGCGARRDRRLSRRGDDADRRPRRRRPGSGCGTADPAGRWRPRRRRSPPATSGERPGGGVSPSGLDDRCRDRAEPGVRRGAPCSRRSCSRLWMLLRWLRDRRVRRRSFVVGRG